MKPEKTRRRTELTVAVRRQTPEEERRFTAALELLLTDMVRQEIAGRKDGKDGKEEATG
jgi:hypothetical protein